MKIVSFSSVDICTESFGLEENPALLLIMGAMSSMIWWEDEFCEKLANKGFFVIRYDNRDTGKSTCYAPGHPEYTFEDLADDAIQVLDAYEIDKAIIMGMSMGGMLTQMIALRHAERVNGIVLLSSMYFAEGAENLPYSSDEVNAFFEKMAKEEPPKNIDDMVELSIRQWHITSKSKRPYDEERIRKLNYLDIEHSVRYESRINHSIAQVTGDELGRIAEIKAPALIIHGTDDVVIPFIHGEMLNKTIPTAQLISVDGAGHELNPKDYDYIIESMYVMFNDID
ncbi:alpha/beta hydrolase [Sedimentibacter sp.]|uniref:alpha/beta fold hydrolase n=1 Tax=Sedimentibacter sp. TaxID=1960295 RepID=UPI0028B232B7|nr:alpha/beta hydrolase [Sedimentibacter sp.]